MAGRSRFQVRWTWTAKQDLAAIVDFLVEHGPDTAERIFDRLEGAARRLEHLPGRGRIVPELQDQGIALYHELVCRPWRIIYRIERSDVLIEAVIDSRRNLEDLLLERFLR